MSVLVHAMPIPLTSTASFHTRRGRFCNHFLTRYSSVPGLTTAAAICRKHEKRIVAMSLCRIKLDVSSMEGLFASHIPAAILASHGVTARFALNTLLGRRDESEPPSRIAYANACSFCSDCLHAVKHVRFDRGRETLGQAEAANVLQKRIHSCF